MTDAPAPRRLARWAMNAPIVAWWATLLVLGILRSPLAIAWFVSGVLMLTNCVCSEVEAEETDHG